MESDRAFEVDADLDTLNRLSSRSQERASHKGRDALEAAFGRFGSHKERDHEQTPLLQRDTDGVDELEGDRESGGDDGRVPPTWEGERDFEGRPWWNKPSVR